MRRDIEVVYWRDANFSRDEDEEPSDADDFMMATVGWVSETKKWLRVASERTLTGKAGDRCITRIPIDGVVRREVLIPKAGTLTQSPVV